MCVIAGSWAEYTLAEESWLAHVPKKVDMATLAGTVPLVALTAYQVMYSICLF